MGCERNIIIYYFNFPTQPFFIGSFIKKSEPGNIKIECERAVFIFLQL